MTCSGCSGAVDRVLKKTEGVASYDISLEKQEVLVKGTIPYDDLKAKIAKTGKEIISGETVA
ncbi:copper chaperone taha [Polyporus arcularius HHB13444]|uniref:Copper chaperone taha n=2 Tax=Polyporaceae TaxID=5317 RepID=A0A5C3PHA7_9APHY|nr:copper chaperone taha [Polyporus brumalis]TFK89135.1 copper chaperone taha [Polyporus arcularius HHB13444]